MRRREGAGPNPKQINRAASAQTSPQGANARSQTQNLTARGRVNRRQRDDQTFDTACSVKQGSDGNRLRQRTVEEQRDHVSAPEQLGETFFVVAHRDSNDVTTGAAEVSRVVGAHVVGPLLEHFLRLCVVRGNTRGAPNDLGVEIENDGACRTRASSQGREFCVELLPWIFGTHCWQSIDGFLNDLLEAAAERRQAFLHQLGVGNGGVEDRDDPRVGKRVPRRIWGRGRFAADFDASIHRSQLGLHHLQ